MSTTAPSPVSSSSSPAKARKDPPTAPLPFNQEAQQDLLKAERTHLPILLQRLGLNEIDLSSHPRIRRALVLICAHSWMNITWYEAAIARRSVRQRVGISFTVLIVILLLSVGVYAALHKDSNALAAVASTITGVLILMAPVSKFADQGVHIAAFHKAASELKSAYYAYEDKWVRRLVASTEDKDLLFDQLEVDSFSLVASSQTIVDVETQAYFQRMVSPSSVVQSTLDLIRKDKLLSTIDQGVKPKAKSRAAEAKALAEKLEAAQTRCREAKKALREAHAAQMILKNQANVPEAELQVAQKKVWTAEQELAAAQASLNYINESEGL